MNIQKEQKVPNKSTDTQRLNRLALVVKNEGSIEILRNEVDAAGGLRAYLDTIGDGHAPF